MVFAPRRVWQASAFAQERQAKIERAESIRAARKAEAAQRAVREVR